MKRQDKLNFSPTFSQLLDFLSLSLKFLLLRLQTTHNAQLCSMPATFKANERCYNRTFGPYGLETLNHRSELKILWDTFRSQISELWFPYDRRIANDRRRSQKIEHGSIFCDHDRRIAGDPRSVFPYDRRRSQNFLRSAIRDRLRSYGNQPLMAV